MIRRLIACLRKPEPVVDMADLIIAKRSTESRRNQSAAGSYQRIHTILKQGLRK